MRGGKVTKGALFFHNNAPAHWALTTQRKLAYLGFQCPDHPPYFPNLAPSDYRLFPRLQKQVKGRNFSSRRPGWTDIILILFEWLAKVRAMG